MTHAHRLHFLIRTFLSLTVSSQDGVCVSQVNVFVTTVGPVKAAVVWSPQQPANQPTACYAAGGGNACAASVCVTTTGTLGTSVRNALLAKSPANHTGTCPFLFPTTKHEESFYRDSCI